VDGPVIVNRLLQRPQCAELRNRGNLPTTTWIMHETALSTEGEAVMAPSSSILNRC